MPFSVEWENAERTVIRMTLPETFTWEEYAEVNTAFCALHRTVTHEVCSILDVRSLKKLPPNALVQFPRLAQKRPRNMSLMVVVGAHGYLRHLAQIFARVYGRTHLTNTMEEALGLVEERPPVPCAAQPLTVR